LLLKVAGLISLRSFSPDGRQAVLSASGPKTRSDVLMTTIGPPVETRPLIQTPYSEAYGALSPDGRFLAYASDETGRFEVYVRPFPSVDQGRWQISIEGGTEPRWANSGRDLFFSNFGLSLRPAEPAILSVAIQSGPAFVAGRPGVVVKRPESAGPNYDVAPDGRFLFTVTPKTAVVARPKIIIVQNWFDELRARVPVSSR
jgi:serine/threonine-protein kinase